MDMVKKDLGEKGLSGEEVQDRDLLRRVIRNVDPTSMGKDGEKEKEVKLRTYQHFLIDATYITN